MIRRLYRILASCCLLGGVVLAYAAPAAPIEVVPEAEFVKVWPGLRFVVPDDRNLSPDQAAELASGSTALSVDSPHRIVGRGTSPHWARFSLHNPADAAQLRLFALESTTQYDTRLFERDETGAWRQLRSLAEAAAGRIGGGTTHPVWTLHLAPHRTADLLLRIEGPAIVRYPAFLYSPAGFAEQGHKTHILMGVAFGICLLIGLYIGSLHRYLDDASIPLFLCMLVADMVAGMWLSGFWGELFPAAPETLLSPIGFAAYAILIGSSSLHARIYLNLAAWSPGSDRLLQAVGGVSLGLAPWFSLAFPAAARIFLAWGGAAVALVVVAVSILAARRRVPFSGFIAAAWLSYLLVSGSFLVARLVDDPRLWSSSALALVQTTVIALLFGLAMSQRVMRQRDALVAARQEAVSQQEKGAALMRERSLFFAATAHDLRQPLVGVRLFADLLNSSHTSAERDEHARKLDQALKEVDGLLVGIQQLAQAHEASYHPPLEAAKLDDLLAPIVEEYRGRSEYKRVAIRYVPSGLSITTHVPYFQRIVRNALSNAIRYTDQGDRILVGCRRGGGLRLVIADTGHGMTEAQARLAFDAFSRFDAERNIPDGFGLGLFSTKVLAHALGMEVGLRSGKNRGTEFRIYCRGQPGNAVSGAPTS